MSQDKDQAKSIPIEAVLRQVGIKVRDRTARYIRMRCPFHDSKDEDFVVDTEKNHCYCMSPSCRMHKAADPITLIMRMQNVGFQAAIGILLGGATITYQRPPAKPEKSPDQKLRDIAAIFRQSRSDEAKKMAVEYWTGRGLPAQVVTDYQLGYYRQYPIRPDMRPHFRFSIPWFSNNKPVAIAGRLDEAWARNALGSGEDQSVVYGSKYMGPAVDKKNRVFNNRRLYQDGSFVARRVAFVTESEADVMSIEWAGRQPCVGSKMSPHIETLMQNVDVPIVIAQRDHGAGMMYARMVQDLIKKPAPIFEVPAPYKDPNEMAKDGVLKEFIDWIIAEVFGYGQVHSKVA